MKYCILCKVYKALALLFFLTLACGNIQADERDHRIQGHVFDNISGQGIADAKIYLMTGDSVVIDTVSSIGDEGYYAFEHLRKVGSYIIKATHNSYEDGYTALRLRSNRESAIFAKPILMPKIRMLKELTVTSTKVKMVMKGDTIVYNADAFNLAEGSMLDALIARLPGAKFTKDGKIYLNGKFIQDLLVNGQDFFSGNPKVALENLPAYTVKKIKVYDKDGAASRLMNRDMGDKVYVMDVNLKKEYAVGYLGNAEAGIGTSSHYLTKSFVMRFSDLGRAAAFANVNNLNDNQRGNVSGEWTPQDMPEGLLATKTGGFTCYHTINGKPVDFIGTDNIYTHTGTDSKSISSSQTFLPSGDSFSNCMDNSSSSSDKWDSRNQFYLQHNAYYSCSDLNFTYHKRRGWNNSNSTTSDSTSILNKMLSTNSIESKDINVEFKNENGIKIIADMIRLGVSMDYNRNVETRFSVNDVQYSDGSLPRDYRNNYQDELNQHLNLQATASYSYGIGTRTLNYGYEYKYSYVKSSNMLYRLDKLSGYDSTQFCLLPSATEALLDVIDKNNSYHFHEYRNEHKFYFSTHDIYLNFIDSHLDIQLPLRLVHANLYYYRQGRHDVSRHRLFFEPSIRLFHDSEATNWEINANMTSRFPDLTTMIDYRDDSNPLNIRLGNANLRNIHQYDVNGRIVWKGNHQKLICLSLGYHQTDNDVAYGITFDRNTGISTVRPVSINGNWSTDIAQNFSRSLDEKDMFTIDNQLSASYNHHVDMATVEGYAASQRSIVNNWNFGDALKFNFRPNDDYEFSLHCGGNYYLIRSSREGFSDINAGNYNMGFNTQVTLPWEFSLTSDITMFARRGYQSSAMNTTDWVWNAVLTRRWMKDRLLTKLQGFDILHQLSNTQYAMNAQGRTETWHNSIPRYVMFTLSWKFNINPKKK